jgi:hypothetical protein
MGGSEKGQNYSDVIYGGSPRQYQNSDLYALIALDQFFMGKSKTPPWLSKNSRLWYLFNLFSVI